MRLLNHIEFCSLARIVAVALSLLAPTVNFAQTHGTAATTQDRASTGILSLRLVDSSGEPDKPGNEPMHSSEGLLWLKPDVLVDNSGVTDARVYEKISVRLWLTPKAAKRLAEAHSANLGGRIAVVVDGQVIQVFEINMPFSGRSIIIEPLGVQRKIVTSPRFDVVARPTPENAANAERLASNINESRARAPREPR